MQCAHGLYGILFFNFVQQLSLLESVMESALEKGRTEFVELLLEHGVNMAKFLTFDRLESLYNVVGIKEFSFCYNVA